MLSAFLITMLSTFIKGDSNVREDLLPDLSLQQAGSIVYDLQVQRVVHLQPVLDLLRDQLVHIRYEIGVVSR